MGKPRFKSRGAAAMALGFRSGLEANVSSSLARRLGFEPEYEKRKLRYVVPERKATYTPDFILPNGIVIETKGRFTADDRQKHLLIADQHPDLDVRFVFSSSKAKLYAGSSTTYAMWCAKFGFKFADKDVPDAWLVSDADDAKRLAALERATHRSKD